MKIKVRINDINRELITEPSENVRSLLRRANISLMRDGCDGQGSCGACTIILDGKTVNSCLLLSPQIDGKTIYTVEHLAKNRQLSAIQTAFLDAGVVQCGYCTPAMLLATKQLLEKTPQPTREQIKSAFSGIFCRCTGYEQYFAAVDLASRRLKDPESLAAKGPEFRDHLRVVGKAKRKVDGPRLVRGDRAFVEDMVQPGTCYLKMLRSPHAHAYIKDIDTSEAEALPGVVHIVTHKNCPDIYYNQAGQGFPEPSPYDRKLISEKVRHVGDRVAAVVAETKELAEQASKKIKVTYEVLQPVFTIDEAARKDAPLIHNSQLEYVVGAPVGLDNSQANPRDGKIIYQ
ncbi:MAG TPA: 2Fe-2S iron-sulfur cluster-binding protein, partial [bacterium]|nr:2Fe-2S iron-sulfur cluster-binding protein [bacterium]